MWFSPEQIEMFREMQETDLQSAREAAEEAARKKAEDELKTFDELLLDAKENCKVAGERLSSRILGVLDREAGKMVDQFPILADYGEDTAKLLGVSFLIAFDKEIKKRSYVQAALKEKRAEASKKRKLKTKNE